MEAFGRPVVGLEAGAGPDNPPCPACGEPLFGWALLRPESTPVRRCELCGMAVAGGPAAAEEAKAALEIAVARGERLANRRSLQAWIGGSGWAGLSAGSRFAFTAEAVERLGAEATRPSFAPLLMWQTLVNSFTFGHNLALGWSGRKTGAGDGPTPTPADRPWRRALDLAITTLTAIPLIAVAVLLEVPAWALGRGGTFQIKPGRQPGP